MVTDKDFFDQLKVTENDAIIVSREPVHYQPVVKEALDETSDDDLGWLWMSLSYILNSLPDFQYDRHLQVRYPQRGRRGDRDWTRGR